MSVNPPLHPPVKPTIAMLESPSLHALGDHQVSYELKFLVTSAVAKEVEAWASRRLRPDPYADPNLGGAYSIASLYCDTPRLDVYHGRRSYGRRKYRIRRYGDASWLYLERKTRMGDRVAKRRTRVDLADLSQMDEGLPSADWCGLWFQRRLKIRGLRPACQLNYLRWAFMDGTSDGPLRLTLDRQVRGQLIDQWRIGSADQAKELLADQVIVELKFRHALPATFKELLGDLQLTPVRVSKHRLCRQAWGAPAVGTQSAANPSVETMAAGEMADARMAE